MDFVPATVGLVGSGHSGCTGVVVALNKILTAAHCNANGGFNKGTQISLLGHDGYVLTKTIVVNFQAHPSWQPDNVKNRINSDRYHDLAILEVADTFIIPSAKINLKPLVAESHILVGGFGCKGETNGTYSPGLTGRYKKIKAVGKTDMSVGFLDADRSGNSMGCPGDSGGPAYIYNDRSQTYDVVGINRAVAGSDSIYIDTLSGKVQTYSRDLEPTFYISIFDKNLFGIQDWLRTLLPAASFTQ